MSQQGPRQPDTRSELMLQDRFRPELQRATEAAAARGGDSDRRWVVVLAGGSGSRLASLTSDAHGNSVPKQYCSLFGGRSLLGDALARGERMAPRERIITVVAREHELLWCRDLRGWPVQNVIVQPRNRGTAAGILLPLLAIMARDPDAQVTLMPSDHFIADEASLLASLRAAQDAADGGADRVLLVGIEPDGPEVDYGWILPGAAGESVRAVKRFVEKPNRRAAVDLMGRGAVWNSFLVIGTARALFRLYSERQPQLLAAFLQAEVDVHPANGDRLYGSIRDVDFCRDLLAGSESELGLCVAPACGWTDLGTPSRVSQCANQLVHSSDRAVHPSSLAAAAFARCRDSVSLVGATGSNPRNPTRTPNTQGVAK